MLKLLKIFYFIALLGGCNFAFANNFYKNLRIIKQDIYNVNSKLKKKEQENNLIKLELKRTDIEIKNIEDHLNKINIDKHNIINDLYSMQQELSSLELSIRNIEANISRLLNSQYKINQPLALVLMLENIDPNEKGRQFHYLRYIQNANINQIKKLREQKIKVLDQKELISKKLDFLEVLINKKKLLLLELNKKKKVQVNRSRVLDEDIKNFYNRLNKLKVNEVKLNSLILSLANEKSKESKVHKSITNNSSMVSSGRLLKDKKASGSNIFVNRKSFGSWQGKLDFPVDGTVTGFFGKFKSDNDVWGGIFIKSYNSDVCSIYDGEVVYIGYFNGYGNTIIIDHNNYYLTVYAGLSVMDVIIGQKVSKGFKIGKTGVFPGFGNGLYFEIRYRSTQLNPLNWLRSASN